MERISIHAIKKFCRFVTARRITSPGSFNPAVFIPEFFPQHGVAFIHGSFANLPQHDIIVAAVADVIRDGYDLFATLLGATRRTGASLSISLLRPRATAAAAAARRLAVLALRLLAAGL